MGTEFLQGMITIPTPFMTEAQRLVEVSNKRKELEAQGMMIISERRVRNIAFDNKDERTTFNLTIKPNKV